MTYLAASNRSARSLGEENMVHAPRKSWRASDALTKSRFVRQIFCLKNLIFLMGLLRDLQMEIGKNMFGVVPGSRYGWPKNVLH